MNRVVLSLFAVKIFLTPLALTAESTKHPTLSFTTVERGRKLVTTRDDFVKRLSPFDRAARMNTDKDVSERDYLRVVGESVLAWISEEQASVESAWAALTSKLEEMSLPFPKTIYLVKTSGAEEGARSILAEPKSFSLNPHSTRRSELSSKPQLHTNSSIFSRATLPNSAKGSMPSSDFSRVAKSRSRRRLHLES
jgi:hypothetical protein